MFDGDGPEMRGQARAENFAAGLDGKRRCRAFQPAAGLGANLIGAPTVCSRAKWVGGFHGRWPNTMLGGLRLIIIESFTTLLPFDERVIRLERGSSIARYAVFGDAQPIW